MNDRLSIARMLAEALIDSRWDKANLVERGSQLVGKRGRWLGPLVDRLLTEFPGPPRPRAASVARIILADAGFSRARLPTRRSAGFQVRPTPEMDDRLSAAGEVPSLSTAAELADWLRVTVSELDWFADLKCLVRHARQGKLLHYHFRLLAKRFGAMRLIESPKPRLKAIQRRLLREILDRVAPHDAAHGFRRGRSITTFAAPHVGQSVVARMDLKDFFPCISRARSAALTRTIGYPERVAELLAGLCTSAAPSWVWNLGDEALSLEAKRTARARYAVPHLPQGAPTSPAIANLCAYRLDCRLTGLVQSAGARYTRYADDLAFSGDREFARRVNRFLIHVAATVAEEGFCVHHRKTRIMRDGVRQHVAGVVVNRRINVRRCEYDRLKAVLTTAVALELRAKTGPHILIFVPT